MAGHHRILGVSTSRPLAGCVPTRPPVCALPRTGPLGRGAKQLRESQLLPGKSCLPLIAVHPGLRQRLWIVYSVAWGAPRDLLGVGLGLPCPLLQALHLRAFPALLCPLPSGSSTRIRNRRHTVGHFTDVDPPPHSRCQE